MGPAGNKLPKSFGAAGTPQLGVPPHPWAGIVQTSRGCKAFYSALPDYANSSSTEPLCLLSSSLLPLLGSAGKWVYLEPRAVMKQNKLNTTVGIAFPSRRAADVALRGLREMAALPSALPVLISQLHTGLQSTPGLGSGFPQVQKPGAVLCALPGLPKVG